MSFLFLFIWLCCQNSILIFSKGCLLTSILLHFINAASCGSKAIAAIPTCLIPKFLIMQSVAWFTLSTTCVLSGTKTLEKTSLAVRDTHIPSLSLICWPKLNPSISFSMTNWVMSVQPSPVQAYRLELTSFSNNPTTYCLPMSSTISNPMPLGRFWFWALFCWVNVAHELALQNNWDSSGCDGWWALRHIFVLDLSSDLIWKKVSSKLEDGQKWLFLSCYLHS